MPLVECPDCHSQVSDAAPTCIHCGRPLVGGRGTGRSDSALRSDSQAPESFRSAMPLFTVMPAWKLTLLSLATFNLYILQWFYENWRRVQQRERTDIWPAARGLFCIFFASSLFSKVELAASDSKIEIAWRPVTLAAGFILLTLLVRLPDPYWIVTFASVWPLLPVQSTMNDISTRRHEDIRGFDSFSGGQLAALVIGGALWILVLIGLMGT